MINFKHWTYCDIYEATVIKHGAICYFMGHLIKLGWDDLFNKYIKIASTIDDLNDCRVEYNAHLVFQYVAIQVMQIVLLYSVEYRR